MQNEAGENGKTSEVLNKYFLDGITRENTKIRLSDKGFLIQSAQDFFRDPEKEVVSNPHDITGHLCRNGIGARSTGQAD